MTSARRSFVDRSSLAPSTGATGQRNRILQAWSTAAPVVATPVSATGVEPHDGENLLVAKRPDDLAAACAGLLESADLRRSIGEAGRRIALDPYIVEERLHKTQDIPERALHGEFPNASAAPS